MFSAAKGIYFEWPKWWQTMKMQWSNMMAYKLNFIFMVLGPSLVYLFIKYNVWTAIYDLQGQSTIQGYTRSSMINYQLWVFVVGILAQGFNSMDLAIDIRLGRISSYLIYPFDFWQYHSSRFVAFQLMQTCVAIISTLIASATGLLSGLSLHNFLLGLFYCQFVSLFWFASQFLIGILAFWLDQTWVLRVMFLMTASFLSGSMIPLEIFPKGFAHLLNYSPFPYLTYVPTKVFMGAYPDSLKLALVNLLAWTVVLIGLSSVIWKRGIKLYTAAGM